MNHILLFDHYRVACYDDNHAKELIIPATAGYK